MFPMPLTGHRKALARRASMLRQGKARCRSTNSTGQQSTAPLEGSTTHHPGGYALSLTQQQGENNTDILFARGIGEMAKEYARYSAGCELRGRGDGTTWVGRTDLVWSGWVRMASKFKHQLQCVDCGFMGSFLWRNGATVRMYVHTYVLRCKPAGAKGEEGAKGEDIPGGQDTTRHDETSKNKTIYKSVRSSDQILGS